jgi:serine/threonine protein kinase/Tfp pilus assembly protein PilF
MGAQQDRAASIFDAAVELATPEERAAYLDAVCGQDPQLRADVEELLAHDNAAGSFLDRPVRPDPRATAEEPSVREGPGTVIGPYKLVEQIGEGGMGTVWLAQQTAPVKRLVALKLIKAGMDSRQVIARFEAERQALALMDHVHIARVLDAGTTSAGRPYFVMDLVKGVPLTRYCDEHRLTPRQRLELFVPVCQAVQHAHQKGIIHRDLKPSNVLVALYDGQPVPKVIDFGVAKAAGQPLTEKTLVTGFGNIVGTLEYMSPEQAEINQLDIDTRSDIYALGALLYELLTGSPPFSRQEMGSGGLLEMLRVIREQEPTKPSAKLSTAEGLPTLAANRGTEPAKLMRLVRGELDWIVLKALEKDRARRYETANGFAGDVQRYLADEPVLACPPSAAYRLRKFVRRNKGSVLAASLVFLALVGGVIGTSWGYVQAENARQGEEGQRLAAEANADRAVKAQARAEQGFAKAKEAVEHYLKAVTDDPDLRHKHDLRALRKRLLEAAVPFYQWFTEQKPGAPALEAERARAYWRLAFVRNELGEKQTARKEYERMRAIFARLADDFPAVPAYRQELAGSHNNLGALLVDLGRWPAAEQAYRRALDLRQKLADDFPTMPEYRQELAMSYNNLGLLLKEQGQRLAAERALRRAQDLYARLADEFPNRGEYRRDVAMSHNNLGLLLQEQGQRPAAERAFRQSLDLRERLAKANPTLPDCRRDLATSHNNLGDLLKELGQWAAAEQAYRRALDIDQKLADDFSTVPEYRRGLARSHNNLGRLLGNLGQGPAAERALRQALDIHQKLSEDFLTVPEYRRGLASIQNSLGLLLKELGQLPAAERALRRALDLRQKLADDFPTMPDYRRELAISHAGLGLLLRDLGQRPAAERALRQALDIRQKLADDFPTVPVYSQQLAMSLGNLGVLLKGTAAEQAYRRGLDLFEKLAQDFPNEPACRRDLALSHNGLGNLLKERGQRPEAERAYRRALDLFEKLADDFPTVPEYRHELARTHSNLGLLLVDLGQRPAAERAYRRALDLFEKLTDNFPPMPGYRRDLAGSCINFGIFLVGQRQTEAGLTWYARAIALLEPLVRQEPRPTAERLYLRNAHWSRAQALDTLGRHADAVKDWDRALQLNAVAVQEPAFRFSLARSLARAGEHARAVAEANLLAEPASARSPFPGPALYELACVCAIASGKVRDAESASADAPRLAGEYAARAVELLRQAVAKGYKDVARLKKDRDLDAVRDREDFKRLVAGLEAKKG